MVERLALEEGHFEFVGDERRADVVGEARVPFHRRQVAHAAAFVGDRVALADAQREG
jgi:hypothetical protein